METCSGFNCFDWLTLALEKQVFESMDERVLAASKVETTLKTLLFNVVIGSLRRR